nr:MAG TPA: CD34/Podocalyxin family [Caudoviricetes sp.]
MKTSDIIKIGAGIFGIINLGYVGYSLVKNYKDYKNQTGAYAPEQEEITSQIDLFDGMEAGLEEVEPEVVVEKKPKRKIKKSVWIGVGLLSIAVIGGYCYGYKSAWRKGQGLLKEEELKYDLLGVEYDDLKAHLSDTIEKYETTVEKVSSNALDMLLPNQLETRWITVNDEGYAHSNYTPKVTDDHSAEDIAEAVKSAWEKLYEPVVVVPAVEEA